MFKLDDNFLNELGLGSLPAAEKNKMLSHIYETLEMKVGMRLAEKMSNEQLDEFEAFINRNDEAGALKWLESNFPNYKEVVAEELEKLKGEIRQVAPQIIAQAASTLPPASAQPPSAMPPSGNPYPAYTAPQQPAYPQQQPAPQMPSQMQPSYPPQQPASPQQPVFGSAPMAPQQDFGMPQPAAPVAMPAYDPAPIQQHPAYQPPAPVQAQPPQQFANPMPPQPQPNFGTAPTSYPQQAQPQQPQQPQSQPDPFGMPAPIQGSPAYGASNDPGSAFTPFDQQAPSQQQPSINFAQPQVQNPGAAYGSTQPSAGFGVDNRFAGASPSDMQQTQAPPEPYQPPR